MKKCRNIKLISLLRITCIRLEEITLIRFVDDLAGAIFDFFKFILTSLSYLIAGMLIVGVPLFLLAMILEWIM